ncbi:MAG TPA: aminotransferase class V-fold PLP-dependent enzyme [Acidimicrobiales bacterium]|jgi:cysteine desulfurase|nr:aminotransferase class V-fold PLP-dependent enzyme [Acidimicrobiales bacterium]
MPRAFLDCASAAPLRPEVRATIAEWLTLPQADPGRGYEEALIVRRAVEAARDAVARLVHATPRQVVFTSSISESVNTSVAAALRDGGRVVAAPVERASVLEAAARWGELATLEVDHDGRVRLAALDAALAVAPTALVCLQLANHETGTLLDVAPLLERAHAAGAAVHLDATVAVGHVELDVAALGAEYTTLSAEGLGAPLGTGALVVRRGLRLAPLLVGGDQERARRAGLENVGGILGLGAAAGVLGEDGGARLRAEAEAAAALIARAEEGVRAFEGVRAIGDPTAAGRVPHVRCFVVEGVEAEPVLLGLDRYGVSVHSGSACSSESLERSEVLAAMGVDEDHSLRVSVGWSTTTDDVDAFLEAFPKVLSELRALR